MDLIGVKIPPTKKIKIGVKNPTIKPKKIGVNRISMDLIGVKFHQPKNSNRCKNPPPTQNTNLIGVKSHQICG